MGDNSGMIKLCVFDTFGECRDSQHYDHLYQKALNFSVITGIELSTIRNLNLHIQDEKGIFPIQKYIADNDIKLEFPQEFEKAKYCWRNTTAWSFLYKFEDKFVYLKDHSDRTYNIITVPSFSELTLVDNEGNEVEVGQDI